MKIPPFKLQRYIVEHASRAKYSLSSSDCDTVTQKELLVFANSETIRLWENTRLGYTQATGLSVLRNEIAKLYKDIEPTDIIVTSPEAGIFTILNTILEKGDHVICTFGYESLYWPC